MRETARKRLHAFLTDRFDESELRRFVLFRGPRDEQLARELPSGSVSQGTFVYELLNLLDRRGLIDATFFMDLTRERPRFVAEITQIAGEWLDTDSYGSLSLDALSASRSSRGFVRVHAAQGPDQAALATLQKLWRQRNLAAALVTRDEEESACEEKPILRLLLASERFFAQPEIRGKIREWVKAQRTGGPRVVPILLEANGRRFDAIDVLSVLPSRMRPIYESTKPDEVWLDVLQDIEWMLEHPVTPRPELAEPSGAPDGFGVARGSVPAPSPAEHTKVDAVTGPSPRESRPMDRSMNSNIPTKLADIFSTTGVPTLSYVEAAQHVDLVARFDFMGEGLVVEGPSGIGKTTAVQRALEGHFSETLESLQKQRRVTWLEAKSPVDQNRIGRIIKRKIGALKGHIVIDDFHRLDPVLQKAVADLIKSIADASKRDVKVTLIGINPVGESLVRGFPDLAGRFHVVSLRTQPREKILELILKAEREANIEFMHRDDFVSMARGSFFTTQLLCAEAVIMEGLRERPQIKCKIVARPDGAVIDRVSSRLKFKYHEELRTFAAFDEEPPPPRGACLALLWLLSEGNEGSIQLATARARFPALGPAFDWLMASNFFGLFQSRPRLRELFFYNRDGAVLSIEDPQLEFYLAHLNWTAFARDSGHTNVEWRVETGVSFAHTAMQLRSSATRRDIGPGPVPTASILHLSDLHFSDQSQAIVWSAQLREDLQHELGHTSLTAVVLSGDLTNRATSEEFAAATIFLQELRRDFNLSPRQIVVVPGNHDLNWDRSRASYQARRRSDLPASVTEKDGSFIDGNYVEFVTDEEAYRRRFEAFASFYYTACADPYPLDYDQQALIYPFLDAKLLFVGLNSAWHIDHHFTARADIHSVALGRALRAIDNEPLYGDCLKIAVWHHPIQSPDEDRIKDTGFVERLAQASFRFGLHGHIHRADVGQFKYDMTTEGRRLDFLGAGTFGAPTREMHPGYPLQYQLLKLTGRTLRVETRRREQQNGAWKPDARWLQGAGQAPLPWYDIEI